ncbi:MAG: hypothetical protein JSU70_23410 [Phycisphaerales bacterium]|nr:MAG: hypothetical protein JSU70_23410 [Phycisphaerales bacterium]
MIGALRALNRLRRRLGYSVSMEYLLAKYKIKKALRSRNGLPERCRVPDEILFETNGSLGLGQWIFHDENWVRVTNRRKHRRIVAAGKPLDVVDNVQEQTEEVKFLEDGTICFDGKAKTNDEWIYMYLDPEKYPWHNYSWNFRIRRDTYFKEFQFGFRYQDFYNRYRYRFENDHIYFDKVIKGRFWNYFGTAPFHMDLGVWYDVRIDIYENNFRCYVDGKLMLDDYDFDNNFPVGSIAVILWEKDGATDIRAAVGPMSIRRLLDEHEGDSNTGGS